MTAPRCARCGAPFELRRADDRYCPPCEAQVAALIAADAKRRTPRWPAKDLTVGAVL